MTAAGLRFERLVTHQTKAGFMQFEVKNKHVDDRTKFRKLIERNGAEVSGLISFALSPYPDQIEAMRISEIWLEKTKTLILPTQLLGLSF